MGESSGLLGRGDGGGVVGVRVASGVWTAVGGWKILLVIAAAVVLGVSLMSSTPHSLPVPQPVHLPKGVSEVARRSPDYHFKYFKPPTPCYPSSLSEASAE